MYSRVNKVLRESFIQDEKEGYENKTKDNYILRFSWHQKWPPQYYESNTLSEPLTQVEEMCTPTSIYYK